MTITTQDYKFLIFNGIQNLPKALLVEINNLIHFIREKLNESDSRSEQYNLLLNQDLEILDEAELNHLEAEIADYDRLYPRE